MTVEFTSKEIEILDKLVEEHHLKAAGATRDNPRLAELRQQCRTLAIRQSVPERLAMMTELNRRLLAERGLSLDELEKDMSVRIVKRSLED